MAFKSEFDQLLEDGESVPTEGWTFSWFNDRATEERPSWAYSKSLAHRLANAYAALDFQTGGGEVFAEAISHSPRKPDALVATESWKPNVDVARRTLAPFDVSVIETSGGATLPLDDESFDLVCSRHPTATPWGEIARVLRPGGLFYSQQVGSRTNRELTDFMMGPQTASLKPSAPVIAASAEKVGLEVIDLREETLSVRFFDVGAVVYFLRKVIWTVPDFSVERYRERLEAMHEHIETHGSFQSHARRVLIEAKRRSG